MNRKLVHENVISIKNRAMIVVASGRKSLIKGSISLFILFVVIASSSLAYTAVFSNKLTTLYKEKIQVRYYSMLLRVNTLELYHNMHGLMMVNPNDSLRISEYTDKINEHRSLVKKYSNLLSSYERAELREYFNEFNNLLIYSDDVREQILLLFNSGELSEASILISTEGKKSMHDMLTCLKSITDLTDAQSENAYEDLTKQATQSLIVMAVLSLMLILSGIIVVIFFFKHLDKARNLLYEAYEELDDMITALAITDEAFFHNLRALEQETYALEEAKNRYSISLEAATDVIWEYSLDTNVFFASDKWVDVMTHPYDDITIDKIFSFIHSEDKYLLEDILNRQDAYFSTQFRILTKDGSYKWINCRGRFLEDRITGSFSDITKQKHDEELLNFNANFDSLTGLPNRTHFIKRLEIAIGNSIDEGILGAVVFIDIDDFKVINDMYSHSFGDRFIKEIGTLICNVVGPDCLVARFGGDEFLVLVEDVKDRNSLTDFSNSILKAISEPLEIEGKQFHISASIGIDIFPSDGRDSDTVLKNADTAVNASKALGRNRASFYKDSMLDKVERAKHVEYAIRRAIEIDSVYMVYMPQVDAITKRTIAVESLMRIKDPELGAISPNEFIPIAEYTGLIVPLGYRALKSSLLAYNEFTRHGLKLSHISVNVSEVQLRQRDFFDNLQRIFIETEADPTKLHLEITESMLLRSIDKKIALFKKLHSIGIKIELDDFGTGFSSLNYLRTIKFDVIKIDRCFVNEISRNIQRESLIDIIVQISKIINAETVAEGVETLEQAKFLTDIGIDYLQGFYFSRPKSFDEILNG